MKKIGSQTMLTPSQPQIAAAASAVGSKEGEGPLGAYFDEVITDAYDGKDTWEKAESSLTLRAYKNMMSKAKLQDEDIDVIIAGDLLNQSISSVFALRGIEKPFIGIYGACSTIAEGMCLAALMVDGDYARRVVCAASSHFCSAERQFRAPLELGNQRCPAAQWTATAAGCIMIGRAVDTPSDAQSDAQRDAKGDAQSGNTSCKPRIDMVTLGKMVDFGVTDSTNLGATMAPAAADTIVTHFQDTGKRPEDYDLIVTGDLGKVGSALCIDLVSQNGYNIATRHRDCGDMIFDNLPQDAHAGGSGCGCAAAVLSSYFMKQFETGAVKRILFLATGALFSPTSQMQGESIPGIAHALSISI